MKLKKEIIIGLIGVITLAFAYWGFTFLKAKDFLNNNPSMVVIYNRISGLTVSNPVMINGFKVGHVTDVYLLPNDSLARIVVKIQISKKVQIPKNTIAKIESDFLGTNKINLIFQPSNEFAKNGDTLRAEIATTIQEEVNAQMSPIKAKAEQMMSSLDSVLVAIQYIFNKETQQSIAKSFKNIQSTIENLQHTSYNLDTLMSTQKSRLARIFSNVEAISYNLSQNTEKIDNIINNFSQFSDSLAAINMKETFAKTDKILTEISLISEKINSGKGSLGLLVNDDKLYNDLETSTMQLNKLLEDMRLHPRRYVHFSVFGGSEKKDDKKASKQLNQ